MQQVLARTPEEGGLPRARLKVGYNVSDGTLAARVYRDTRKKGRVWEGRGEGEGEGEGGRGREV